ncbi:class I SAM-dependent methyltransferase [uncultured Amnibacterium sp.]|uniref:class I SAM-dependent methyltransferase n=1 Tax=uncultured Amnibacterium sp. TaxID=1631851 RepID=UPI0035CBE633
MFTDIPDGTTAQQFWDGFYGARQVWSGDPNPLLVREVEHLGPGTAVDLGCGEGADVIWLAARGWDVLGIDVAPTALARAADYAARAGVTASAHWQAADLAAWRPERQYDLVTVQYLHSPVALDRTRILGTAASATAPGGTLVVLSHAAMPDWHDPAVALPTLEDVQRDLALPRDQWRLETREVVERTISDADGRSGTRSDSVIRGVRI